MGGPVPAGPGWWAGELNGIWRVEANRSRKLKVPNASDEDGKKRTRFGTKLWKNWLKFPNW